MRPSCLSYFELFKIYIMFPYIHFSWSEYCSFSASCVELSTCDELLKHMTSYYLHWNNTHLACVVSSCFKIYPCLHITWCEYKKFSKIEFIDQYIRWWAAEKWLRFFWHKNSHIFLVLFSSCIEIYHSLTHHTHALSGAAKWLHAS